MDITSELSQQKEEGPRNFNYDMTIWECWNLQLYIPALRHTPFLSGNWGAAAVTILILSFVVFIDGSSESLLFILSKLS